MIDPAAARFLAAVIDEGTLDAAARRLNVTSSAVSQRLKQLEQHTGQRLLVRSKPAKLTPAGEIVVRFARQVEILHHDSAAALGLEGDGSRARMTIAVPADSLAAWFLEPLATFTSRSDVEVEIVRGDQVDTARMLESGACVAAASSASAPPAGCTTYPLIPLAYRAAASPSWLERWAPAGGMTRAVLRAAPYLDFDRSDSLQAEWLKRHGVDRATPPRHFVPATREFHRAIELGMGWGMVPERDLARSIEQGTLVDLGGPTISTPLFWHRVAIESKTLDELTNLVVAAAGGSLQRPTTSHRSTTP